ncbi:MAG: efflux RND transporter periplasmic adaptor subunit [bacterium]|nr:efflux RND transporter periplasmic adaptor subunit [bacterium]
MMGPMNAAVTSPRHASFRRAFRHGRTALLSGLSVSLMAAAGCGGKRMPPKQAVPVKTGTVAVEPRPVSLFSVGTVEPVETAAVRPQVGGVITAVAFSEGQDVRQGQLLFRIDPRPFEAGLAAARAQFSRDSSQAANAALQARRYAELVQKDYVTAEQYDAVRTQAEMLRSLVRQDEAAIAQAELNLAYASVTAPISGRAGGLLVKKGNVVRANDAALVVIHQMRPIRVRFAVPENQLGRIRRYAASEPLAAVVRPARGGDGPEIRGRLLFVDNEVDAGTGTVTLKAEFPNADMALWPGQFVDVELVLTIERNALTVPDAAVVTGQEGTFVYVVTAEGRAEKRNVRVDRILGGAAVIAEGLRGGETVVTDGQMRLIPGAAVEVLTDSPSDPGSTPPGGKKPAAGEKRPAPAGREKSGR